MLKIGFQKVDLSFQSQKHCAYSFINSVDFSPESKILSEELIKFVKEAKFLELIFLCTKLAFRTHVQYHETSCHKAFDILPSQKTKAFPINVDLSTMFFLKPHSFS